MMEPFLTPSQRVHLKSAHRLETRSKVRDRIKAVAWADQGEAVPRIAQLLMVDEETVRRHIRDYLDNDQLGGSEGKLDEAQSKFRDRHWTWAPSRHPSRPRRR